MIKQQTFREMMSDMVSAIKVRDHIYVMVNGPRTTLISRGEEKELREFANQMDRFVVDSSLALKRQAQAAHVQAARAQSAQTDLPPEVSARRGAIQADLLKDLDVDEKDDDDLLESGSFSPEQMKEAKARAQAAAQNQETEVVPPAPVKKPAAKKKGVIRRVDPE